MGILILQGLRSLGFTGKILILAGISLVLASVLLFLPAIPQDLAYHNFSDARRIFGINNFWNVVSNLPFILIALWAALKYLRGSNTLVRDELKIYVWIFYIGFFLTGFGSAWYHLNPNNGTLVWDRLPMTIAFMSFFAMMISLHVDTKAGVKALSPLIILGLFSVFYWAYTENMGRGDLRIYAGVQFIPILLIPLMIFLFPVKAYKFRYFVWLLAAYLSAKVFEHFDKEIHALIPMSGHALKHVAASLAGIAFYYLITSYERNG